MKKTTLQLASLLISLWVSTIAVHAKSIEDVFTDYLAIRETDPAGFWAMVVSISLLFALAFGLMILTLSYYFKPPFKKK